MNILHEIDVDIVRVNPRGGSRRGSPQYVFAVHPLNVGVRRRSCVPTTEIPVAREVARTYSQCRRLYTDLKKLTNGAKRAACRCCCDRETGTGGECENGRPKCPGEALFPLLDAFLFPRKRLVHRRSCSVLQERRFALTLFLKSVLQTLQSLHGRAFERQPRAAGLLSAGEDNQEPIHAAHTRCKVLGALLRFLALEDETVVAKLREMSQRLFFGRLSLEGWHSDRKNLYFINEDSPKSDNQHPHRDNDDDESEKVISNRAGPAVSGATCRSNSGSIVEECEVSQAGSGLDLEEKKELAM